MRERNKDPKPRRFIGVMPSSQEKPHSSLSCMVAILMKEFGDGEHFWAMQQGRWNWSGLQSHLRRLEKEGLSAVLFGTAFGWIHFLDWCAERKLQFRLPPDTLVFETGGYKGRSRELEPSELHRQLARLLGLRLPQICSEYSMCELSSQAYSFRVQRKNRTHLVFRFPPWCHDRVTQPGSSTPVAKGERGVLEIHDLANLDSCARIRTEDMAIDWEDGFELVGRLPQSGLKGCSLAFERS